MESNKDIKKRTFEALKYPKGSPERDKLNENVLTSEYYKSLKFAVFINGVYKCSVRNKKDSIWVG